MKLFLLPISTRRSLVYCERLKTIPTPGSKPPLTERVINKASETWVSWEKAEKGWQKQVTKLGNRLLSRISYLEYSLRSIPPLTKKRKDDLEQKKLSFECLYPSAHVKQDEVLDILGKIAKERQALHRSRLWLCAVGIPLSAPFMIVPVIPNLPFYWILFRAYCHWTALGGSKMLAYIVDNKAIELQPSKQIEEAYSRQARKELPVSSTKDEMSSEANDASFKSEEVLLLEQSGAERLAKSFDLPELQIEVERAIKQIDRDLQVSKQGEQSASKGS